MVDSSFSFRSLSYLAYAVLLTLVLLYVRFPAEKFKAYCENRIERLLPGSACKVDRIVYRFPLSTVLENVIISRGIDGQEANMVVTRLVVSPEPLQFWKAFKLQGEIYSGLFEAGLDFDTKTQSFQLENIQLEGVAAGELAKSIGLADRQLSGFVGFSGNYQALNSQPGDGTGEGVVEIVAGSMSLLQPILTLSTLEFDQLAVDLAYENGRLSFLEGELLGKDIVADFSGELQLASPLLNSSLLLSGHLEPDEVFLSNQPKQQQVVQRLLQRYKMTVLPFKVGGTVKRPLFRFST
jgi:type II secretion system protein N